MADQDSRISPERYYRTDKSTNRSQRKETKKNFLDIVALIRSVQRSEKKPDCFQIGRNECDEADCSWRQYCLNQDWTDGIEKISPTILKGPRGKKFMRIQIKKIVCSTDFSDLSNQALPYGIALAREFEAKLYVCHVIDLTPTSVAGEVHLYPIEAQNRSLNYAFEQIERLMGNEQVDWEPLIIIGHPADEIRRVAGTKDVDLAISATHGRSGLKRLLLGSVTERLMRTLPCPLLIIRDPVPDLNLSENNTFRFQRILVGCDFSSDSKLAFQYGLNLAQEFQSELHLVHVFEPPEYRDLRKREKEFEENNQKNLRDRLNEKLISMVPEETHHWCSLKTTLLDGQPYKELTRYAEIHKIDMVILGVRGRGLVETLLLGSTTDRVVRRSPCPVLSVRPTLHTGESG
ncbi:MAG: universal stress protein [Deltaproteobacteria bacterium]|nr:universal stress protein [Deltaproteobacteria bacterium]